MGRRSVPGPFDGGRIDSDAGGMSNSSDYNILDAVPLRDTEAAVHMFREADGPGAAKTPQSRLGPIPLIKPPYAHLVAIDLNAGEIAWKVPFGEGSRELREHP